MGVRVRVRVRVRVLGLGLGLVAAVLDASWVSSSRAEV